MQKANPSFPDDKCYKSFPIWLQDNSRRLIDTHSAYKQLRLIKFVANETRFRLVLRHQSAQNNSLKCWRCHLTLQQLMFPADFHYAVIAGFQQLKHFFTRHKCFIAWLHMCKWKIRMHLHLSKASAPCGYLHINAPLPWKCRSVAVYLQGKHNYHQQLLPPFCPAVLATPSLMDARPPAAPWGVLRCRNMLAARCNLLNVV